MKTRCFALLLPAAALLFAAIAQAQVVIVANPGVYTAEISKGDLRDIFTGAASSLKDGSHLDPILLKSGAVHEAFLSGYVGKSDTAFRACWRSLVFSGQGSMPRTLDTEAAVVDYVARNPGSIGYIGPGTRHEGVKVMAVK